MRKVAVIFHSGFGHTRFIAEHLIANLQKNKSLSVFRQEIGQGPIDWQELSEAETFVFGTPTYMGNVSGPFKSFMDETSSIWLKQGWINKLAFGFTTSGAPSGDKLNTLQSLTLFALQHGMMWAGYARLPDFYAGTKPEESRNRLGSFSGLMLQSLNDDPSLAFLPGDITSIGDFAERISELTIHRASPKVGVHETNAILTEHP